MNCRRCGAELQQGMLVCPECGARQRRQARTVRCAYCHRLAPADLAVCPHCGRALRPLVPRPALWAVG
ncbi:MAG TPA: zinc ribbon domain-containing protein, partial [Anaerolineae bacterium]